MHFLKISIFIILLQFLHVESFNHLFRNTYQRQDIFSDIQIIPSINSFEFHTSSNVKVNGGNLNLSPNVPPDQSMDINQISFTYPPGWTNMPETSEKIVDISSTIPPEMSNSTSTTEMPTTTMSDNSTITANSTMDTSSGKNETNQGNPVQSTEIVPFYPYQYDSLYYHYRPLHPVFTPHLIAGFGGPMFVFFFVIIEALRHRFDPNFKSLQRIVGLTPRSFTDSTEREPIMDAIYSLVRKALKSWE